jgi:hypothetical protein
MLLGVAVILPALFVVETKGWVGLMIALVAVFICPRAIFFPLLSRSK